MIFTETKLVGAYIIEIEKMNDERGFFARTWDKDEFSKRGLDSNFIQSSVSHTILRGTIRGMHYQKNPYEESKIIQCTNGKIYDVIIDLRKESKTFKEWFSIELSSNDYKMLYVPKGFAHGFQTLKDNTDVIYQISEQFNNELSAGVRWNDPLFSIKWPIEITIISKRDMNFPSMN